MCVSLTHGSLTFSVSPGIVVIRLAPEGEEVTDGTSRPGSSGAGAVRGVVGMGRTEVALTPDWYVVDRSCGRNRTLCLAGVTQRQHWFGTVTI
jgi:hypothetical protein